MERKTKYRGSKYLKFLALLVIVIALLVISGWLLDIRILKSILPDYISMKFNTALCLGLMGIALYLSRFTANRFKWASISINAFVLISAVLSYIQLILHTNLGIDELFINDIEAVRLQQVHPGRMSPITSFSFSIMAVALIYERLYNKYLLVVQYAFHAVSLISFIAIIGYIFHAPDFYTLNFAISMAVHTAVSFLLLSIGASLIHPHLGITGIFSGKRVGNNMARSLFLQMFTATFIFTYIRYLTHKHNIVSVEFGIALLAISTILISIFIIWETTEKLNKKDDKKRLAEEQFRLVVESAPNALIMSDHTGTITLVNKQAEKIFGYSREEFVGQKIEIIVPESIKGYHHHNRDSYHAAPSVRYFGAGRDLHAKRKNGTEFPVEIGLNPIKSGKTTMVLASIIDITKRKEQEDIINKHVIELKLKNQEMEQFNYIASHDLQEPLRTLSNYMMLLQEDYPELMNEEIQVHLETMDSAVSRMSLLVKSLLDFGRLGRDKKLVTANCNEIVNNVVDDLGLLITNAEAFIKVDGELPVLNVYKTEFRQLLQNLINNAIKFKRQGIPLQINIGCNKNEKFYEFYIKDNGIGIDPKYSKRIFQIFQRLNKESEYEGHGIGLANCRKIAEMHGGSIWVESVPGLGSIFKFTILILDHETPVKLHYAS